MPEEIGQVFVVIVVKYLLQLVHLLIHIMETFYLCSVNIEICNYTPKVAQLPWLLLIQLLDVVSIN